MKNVEAMMTKNGRPDWETPASVFDPLHAEFGFTVDVCATAENAKLPRFFSPEDDGLQQSWFGERVWCNPPYGRALEQWVAKLAGQEADLACGLVPARTDTKWFHRWVWKRADIRFLPGRIKFVGAQFTAPFPAMLCVWR